MIKVLIVEDETDAQILCARISGSTITVTLQNTQLPYMTKRNFC